MTVHILTFLATGHLVYPTIALNTLTGAAVLNQFVRNVDQTVFNPNL
ncbi:hypothetical protein [Paenibacillus sp. Root52]|nr:hypothetical protein [Paenibacillus sp. Root52]